MLHHTAYIHTDPATGQRTLHLDRAATYRAEVLDALEDGPVLITTEQLPRKRSGRFNRYYHGTVLSHVLHALNEAGNDVAVSARNRVIVHRALRDGPLYPDPRPGVPNSTARLDGVQFARYVRSIVEAAQERLNYTIPPPPDKPIL